MNSIRHLTSSRDRSQYTQVPTDVSDHTDSDAEIVERPSRSTSLNEQEKQGHSVYLAVAAERARSRRHGYLLSLSIGLLLSLLLSLGYNLYLHRTVSIHDAKVTAQCTKPAIRREWRSLSPEEQLEYISAVQCMRQQPSRLGLNHSHYDDFPYVHNQVGSYSHSSAAFVVWHRYFIHAFEKSIREVCNYDGHLVYWDWTLDWVDLTAAPVWNDTYGFGGTGNPATSDYTLMDGHCVDSGPFANLQVLYVKNRTEPHCLLRGFNTPEEIRKFREWLRPATIERLMLEDDYDAFNLGLENAAHNAIPRTIRGDFLLFTAPYDPVFFLHHTQIDRMFRTWQRLNPEDRMRQYCGLAARGSKEPARTTDIVPMGGLLADITVGELLDTRTGILCYDYL